MAIRNTVAIRPKAVAGSSQILAAKLPFKIAEHRRTAHFTVGANTHVQARLRRSEAERCHRLKRVV
jgi:hypothetical protein